MITTKNLNVKGSQTTLKRGTSRKGTRLTGSDHKVDRRPGGQRILLGTEFLKKK